MKAVVYTQYGSPDVLHLKEVKKPTPKDNEVLIKIHAASINAADWYLLKGEPFFVRLMAGGLQKPKNTILGADIAGQVEAVGKNVKAFQPGDEVFGDTSGCGLGGFAEYVAVPEDVLVLKPANLTYEEAAAVPLAGVTALQGLRDNGKIRAGQKVLINGASGGVGTFALQLAKAFGAEVTAVCSTKNVDMVRSIGADHVIDYTRENFTKRPERYDLIIAANGYHPLLAYRRVLNRNGTYVMIGGSMTQIFQAMLLGPLVSMMGSKKMGNLMAKSSKQDLVFLKDLLEAGKIKPIIDRCYPLNDTPEALRYLGEVHARGKVVIAVAA
ncbi:MAG: NAD(P)-dependent alcohol dehydrogenase [Anaerolineae bacterium]|nr:NAD(P)-dependent alcohol dehydrogenase [Anaerolineae bacterium]